jgi:PAS domain S-box-containing protein
MAIVSSSEDFQQMIDDMPGAIVVVNQESLIRAVNNDAEKIFGYTRKELVNKHLDILIPLKFKKNHKELVADYFKDPSRKQMGKHRTVLALNKKGNEFEVEILLAPFSIGTRKYAVASVRDISEPISKEKKLAEKVSELDAINQKLNKYSYTVSHDLKAPLKNIKGLTNMLAAKIHKTRQPEDIIKITKYLVESVDFMEEMITNYLEQAKKEKEESDDFFNIYEIIYEITRNIHIPSNFDFQVKCKNSHLPGSKTSFMQVIINLLTNSIKFNNKKKGKAELTCIERENDFLFEFVDFGPGIPEEKLKNIYCLFESSEKGTSSDSHGIGLHTVSSIIDGRGGSISVKSKPGEGTSFIFTWPKSVSSS